MAPREVLTSLVAGVLMGAPLAAPLPASASTGGVAASLPLRGVVIGLDAGHNGGNAAHAGYINRQVPAGFGQYKACDTVGTETRGGYTEHAHNWDVVSRLATDLRRLGATVVLSRSSDTGVGPCVNQRNAIFRKAHVQLAISVHADGAPASARGFHVIYGTHSAGGSSVVSGSRTLAIAIRTAFQRVTGEPRSSYIGGGSALSPRADIAACNLALVPTVMIETGNMKNAADAARLGSASYRQKEADGLAAAVRAFLHR